MGSRWSGATLVVLSFHGFNEEVARHFSRFWKVGVEQMILILIVAAAGLIAAYFLQRKSLDHGNPAQGSIAGSLRDLAARQWLPLSLLGLFAILAALGTTATDPWMPTIAANIAMVAGRTLADPIRTYGRSEPRVRGGGCLSLIVGGSSLHRPVRRVRRDARCILDVLFLWRSAHGRGTLLA